MAERVLARVERRSARAILIDGVGRLVLIRRTKPGRPMYWTTAGGGVEDGDSSVEAAMHREIFEELAGVEMRAPLAPPAVPADASITPHLGMYERAGERLEVLASQAGPVLRRTELGPLAEFNPEPVTDYPMTAIAGDVWAVREPGTVTWIPVTFYTLDCGAKFVHFGARATPKVDDAA